MFYGLINISMLSRGALQLAPIFIAGLLTGNPIWLRVEIVTISTFIAAERSRLAPLALPSHTWSHLGGPPSRNVAEILDFA